MTSDPRGILDNPNAPNQNNPMLGTSATNPTGGTAGVVSGATGVAQGQSQSRSSAPQSGQQVVPNTPGDRALLSPLPGQTKAGSNFGQQVADYERALGYDPRTMSVQGRVTDMMSNPDNPLLRQARNNAKLQMAGRGLKNSSLALQAGEEAAYNAALPIAEADAQIAMENRRAAFGAAFEDQQMQRQHGYDLEKIAKDYENNRELADQQFGFNKELQSREFGHEEKLQERGFGHEKEMQERGFEQDWRMQASQFQHESDRMREQFGYDKHLQAVDLATRERIAALDRQTNERIADKDLAAREREANAQREWSRAEREAQNIYSAEQQFAQNEWQGGQAALERSWKTAESQNERDALWDRAVYELDRQAEQYGLDRESREWIARLQDSSNQNMGVLNSIAGVMTGARQAEAAAAASGAANAGKYIDQIRKNTQNDIDTILGMWGNSEEGKPGHYNRR